MWVKPSQVLLLAVYFFIESPRNVSKLVHSCFKMTTYNIKFVQKFLYQSYCTIDYNRCLKYSNICRTNKF